MKIDVPLNIGDRVWLTTSDRQAVERIIKGVTHSRYDGITKTEYITERYANLNINIKYFVSKKDAELEIARRIIEEQKDESENSEVNDE